MELDAMEVSTEVEQVAVDLPPLVIRVFTGQDERAIELKNHVRQAFQTPGRVLPSASE